MERKTYRGRGWGGAGSDGGVWEGVIRRKRDRLACRRTNRPHERFTDGQTNA